MLELPMTTDTAISAVAFIASIGIIINALEIMSPNKPLNSFFAWKVVRLRYTWLRKKGNPLSFLIRQTPFQILTAVQVAAALVTPFCLFYDVPYTWLLPAFVLSVHLLMTFRFPYSASGADQMQSLIWAGVLGYTITGTDLGEMAALLFIAAQSIFAYFASGYAKLFAKISYWRDGTAVKRVLATKTFGNPALVNNKKFPMNAFSKFASWSTLAFETTAPVLILFGSTATLIFIGMAVAFHTGIAVMMGLNRFLFAFGAALPSVYWVSLQLHTWMGF